MPFNGRAHVIPDRSSLHSALREQGLLPLRLPNGGGSVYVTADDYEDAAVLRGQSKVDIVRDLDPRVERARDAIGRLPFVRAELSPGMGARIIHNGNIEDIEGFLPEAARGPVTR